MAVTISDARIRVTLDTGDAVREAEELDRELEERADRREGERDRRSDREGARADPDSPANRDRGGPGGGGGRSPTFTFTTFGDTDEAGGGGGLTPGGRGRFNVPLPTVSPSGFAGGDGGFSALARTLDRAADIFPVVGAAVGTGLAGAIATERFGPLIAGASDQLGVPIAGDGVDFAGSQVAALRSQFQAFGQTQEQITQEAIAQSRLAGRVDVEGLASVAAARFTVNAEQLRIQREQRAAVKREVGAALATTAGQVVGKLFDMTKAATR